MPLLFDVLKRAGLSSAAINWPCTRGSATLDDNFSDVPEGLKYTRPRLKDELAKDGYTVTGATAGDEFVVTDAQPSGSHGYLSSEPKLNAFFVASGAGIKPGAKLDAIDNVDLALTVARLLGVSLEQATGRVLSEILDDRP